jgi:hypothetical protein
MSGTYLPFAPWRSAREYQGQQGSEVGGLRLPVNVMNSLAETIPKHLPEQYAVKGEWTYPDGRRFLEFAVTTEWIEATTDLRWDPGQRKLRVKCPLCEFWDGKHAKGCKG